MLLSNWFVDESAWDHPCNFFFWERFLYPPKGFLLKTLTRCTSSVLWPSSSPLNEISHSMWIRRVYEVPERSRFQIIRSCPFSTCFPVFSRLRATDTELLMYSIRIDTSTSHMYAFEFRTITTTRCQFSNPMKGHSLWWHEEWTNERRTALREDCDTAPVKQWMSVTNFLWG